MDWVWVMKIVFLEKKNLGDDIDLSAFANLGEVEMYETSTREESKERIKDADIVLINKIEMNEDLLKDAKNVKLIGTDSNIAIPSLRRLNIP